ncbi:MAG: sugar phosphate isomerase/epimerase [Anaerolineae bacterium]|nr:sugar phosphate isomerase/epimerase [Anaerolineae bacterium]
MIQTKRVPVGLQLFSVRGECDKNLPATLKAVADLGYVGAEPWGYDGREPGWKGWSAQEIRAMYDDNGLACCGFHLSTDALLGDNLARTIEFNQILGNKFLIIAADKGRMGALDTIMELADILNGVADKIKPLGMRTGYHAHGFDFVRFGDRTAWEILFSNTSADVVMQLDIGNCAGGGGDPVAMLKAFPGRAKSVHLKDYGGAPESVIGEGVADWNVIFGLCDTLHKPLWYVIEEGSADGLGFEISGRSLQALRKMGR